MNTREAPYRIRIAALMVVLVPAAPVPPAAAQPPWAPQATLLDSYARMISVAVAVEPAAAGATRVYSGAGGDVFLLRHDPSAAQPLALQNPATGPWTLQTGGGVMDIALTADFAYVASFRNGLQIFRRSDDSALCPMASPCWPPPAGSEVLSVAAVDVPTAAGARRIVVLGTERRTPSPTGGSLHVLAHDTIGGGLQILGEWTAGGPVYTVAASVAFPFEPATTGANLTILLGAGCSNISGLPRSLQRRDFAVTASGPSVFATQVLRQGWTMAGPAGVKDMVIRDIVIDPDKPRAYVAAHWDGVWAFDLDPATAVCPDPNVPGGSLFGLCPDPSGGWPLKLPDGYATWSCGGSTPSVLWIPRCLALGIDASSGGGPAAPRRLFAGAGGGSNQAFNLQFLGETQALPCNQASAPPEYAACAEAPQSGIFAWHLGAGDDPVATPSGLFPPGVWRQGGVFPLGMAVRQDPADPARWLVYAANATDGLRLFTERVHPGTGAWEFRPTLAWNAAPPAGMPMSAFDDFLPLTTSAPAGGTVDVLYGAYETGVAAFDLADALPLAAPSTGQNANNPTTPYKVNKGGILVTGFPGPNVRLYAATSRGRPSTPGGIQAYDITDPRRPAAAGAVQIHREGFGYGLVARPGLYFPASPPPPDDRARYVYSVQEVRLVAGAEVEQWSVKVWNPGTANNPIDPCAPPAGTAQTPCNTCVPCVASYANGVQEKRELSGLAVVEGAADVHYVYTLYNPRPQILADPSAPAGEVGLLVLEARLQANGSVTLIPVSASDPPSLPAGHFQALAGPVDASFRAGLATVDPAANRIYGAWTGGIAVFDITVPAHPVLIAARLLGTGDYGLPISPVRVTPGPQVGGRNYAYVPCFNDGIGILDVTDPASFATSPIVFHPMRWQTTTAVLDPRDPTRKRVFVGSGTGGADLVSFQ